MDRVDAGQYRFGEFELDASGRSLTRSGERLALSAKAFDLLVELIKRRGSVATKDELLESVWPNQFVEENNLSVQISALRKLLGEGNGSIKFIETIPGRGYSFVAPVEPLNDDVIVEHRTFERIVVEEAPAEERRELPGRTRSGWLVAAIAIVVLISAGVGIWFWRSSAQSERIDSLAVLPFEYQGARPDADYLSDGITEALINNLSQLPNLTVKARGSVFQFKGQNATPQSAASALDVEAIVLGKIVESGENLALNIELVNAATGDQIWGQRYERRLVDLATLSNEIATDVASKLRLRLGSAPIARGQTKDPEAYDLYLRGRFLWNKRRQADHEKALALFEQAIARDPNFALAYAAIGDVCMVDSYKCPEGTNCTAKGRENALKALELEPNLGEPYATLGNVEWAELNWTKADENYKRSLELSPGYGDAHHWRGEMLARLGRSDEAIAEIRTALLLDPFNQVFTNDAGYIHVYARRFEEGLAFARRSHEMNPDWGANETGWALEYLERYDEAIDAFKSAPVKEGDDPQKIAEFRSDLEKIRLAYRKDGFRGYWHGWLDLELKMAPSTDKYNQHYYNLAIYYAKLGETDKAVEALNASVDDKEFTRTLALVEPHFDSIRNHPRYIEALRKMNLHE